MTAADLYIVQENGATAGFPDWPSSGETVSILYQPEAMRFRGMCVMTNTVPRSAQRGPGHNQTVSAIEPLIDKAAKQLGIDRLAIRRLNGPRMNAKVGENQGPVTSCYLQEAFDKARDAVQLSGAHRAQRPAQRHEGHRHRRRPGVPSGRLRGLRRPRAHHDGRQAALAQRRRQSRHVLAHGHVAHRGRGAEGELGQLHRRARRYAQRLALEHRPVRQQHVVHDGAHELRRGRSTPSTSSKRSRRWIWAARRPTTTSAASACSRRAIPTKGLTYAQAAQRAVELGGKFDGHENPADINPMTAAAATSLAGTGLIGVAKDNLPITASPAAFVAGFAEIELDTETGAFEIIDYVAVADCGTVIHPMGLATQIKGGAVMGFGLATLERHIYDPQNGLPGAVGLHKRSPRPTSTSRRPSRRMPSTCPIRRARSARRASASPSWAPARRRCSARSRMRSAAITSTACP